MRRMNPTPTPIRRSVFVTGAAGGLGAACAIRLARDGYDVVLSDRNADGLQATLARMSPGGHTVCPLDATDEAAVEQALQSAERTHGPLYALVCAVGGTLNHAGHRPRIRELSLEDWRFTFALNMDSVFLCTRAFLRLRAAQTTPAGRIVLFSSIGGQVGSPVTGPAYVAAKAGIIGYARALAQEAAPMGITVNTIAPGTFDTPGFRAAVSAEELANAPGRNLFKRVGNPSEGAAAVAYLLSADAAFVTGSVLDVNGGARMQ